MADFTLGSVLKIRIVCDCRSAIFSMQLYHLHCIMCCMICHKSMSLKRWMFVSFGSTSTCLIYAIKFIVPFSACYLELQMLVHRTETTRSPWAPDLTFQLHWGNPFAYFQGSFKQGVNKLLNLQC